MSPVCICQILVFWPHSGYSSPTTLKIGLRRLGLDAPEILFIFTRACGQSMRGNKMNGNWFFASRCNFSDARHCLDVFWPHFPGAAGARHKLLKLRRVAAAPIILS